MIKFLKDIFMCMYALVNSKIYTGKDILHDHAVIIFNKIIKTICPINKLSNKIKIYDLSGDILSPGFIDLQINGCGGVQFNDDIKSISLQTLEKMQNINQKSGCTSFLPTLITSSDLLIRKAIEIIRIFLLKHENQVLGLHLEGPFLNPIQKGIHNSFFIRTPTEEIINYFCDNNDVIKQITLAPETLNATVIQKLKKSGIYIAIGHSNATYQEARCSFLSGINFGTHLFNAMSPLITREPGVVGAILENPKIYCSVIVDGIHVHWVNIKLAKKIKGDHLILVTDGTSPAGAAADIINFIFSNKMIYHHNGVCIDTQGILSGSALTMIKAIQNSVQYVGIPLDEALRMATLYPARAIGVDHYLGSIEINKIANLAVFDKKYQIKKIVINGMIKNI